MVSRLLIFVIYDKEGIFDKYVFKLFDSLKDFSSKTVVVCNGSIQPEYAEHFKSVCDDFIVRKNIGFDAGAWKYVLCEHFKWQGLENFDEIIFLNDTVYGPFYTFDKIFNKMDSCEVDFWGMTCHDQVFDAFSITESGFIPRHIQSFFMCLRKRLFLSDDFRIYWDSIPYYKNVTEVIANNEVRFAKFFEERGFTWEVYIDTSDLDEMCKGSKRMNHYAYNQYELIKRGFPFFKKKNLSHDYKDMLQFHNGNDNKKCIDFIQNSTDYDVRLIFENATRLYSPYALYTSLGLNYVLPKNVASNMEIVKRVAVVYHAYYMDLFDEVLPLLKRIPEPIDLYLTTSSEEKQKYIVEKLNCVKNKLTVLIAPPRGRDLSALLISVKPYLSRYDYFCFTHDKKSLQVQWPTIARSFFEIILENVLASPEYIYNIIDTFDKTPYLGFIGTPIPKMGEYFYLVGNEWTSNFNCTKELGVELNLHSKPVFDSPPISLGTSFWCRTQALEDLIEHNWEGVFPPEPLPVDGSVSHAIERIFQTAAQNRGYLTGTVCTDEYASLEITNLNYMFCNSVRRLREIPKFKSIGLYATFEHDLIPSNEKNYSSSIHSNLKVYFSVDGTFSENNSQLLKVLKQHKSKLKISYEIPKGVKILRIDPAEVPCAVYINELSVNGVIIPYTHNGVQKKSRLYFDTSDSNIIVQLNDKLTSNGGVLVFDGQVILHNTFFSKCNKLRLLQSTLSVFKIYYTANNIYSEDKLLIKRNLKRNNKINVSFEISDRTKMIRIDPAEVPCMVKIVKLSVSRTEISFTHNGIQNNDNILFDTCDSNIYIDLSNFSNGEILNMKCIINLNN